MALSGHAPPKTVVVVTAVDTAVAFVVTICRVYARVGVARNAGWDDVLILFASVFSIATTITMCIQVRYGMGRQQISITPEDSISQLKAFYVSIWVYNLSLSCTKVSILLQYLRIFPSRVFRICCYTLLTVVVVYSLYAFFTAVFACSPIAYFWDPSIPGGKCLDRFAIWFVNAGINISTDILIAILPLPVLKELELPKRQRRALMVVFALAGFTCIVSILRLQSLYVISTSSNVSWENPLAAIWSSLEINTAIICSCLPTLRCFFPHILKSQLSLSHSSYDNDTSEAGRYTPKFLSKMSRSTVITSATRSPSNPHPSKCGNTFRASREPRSTTSLEAFGRSLQGAHGRSQSTCLGTQSSIDEIEMGETAAGRRPPWPEGRIHVMTAIEQEVESRVYSDSESTRELVKANKGYDFA